ncbi:uncharacterized protein SAPINGB_P000183 [Magnusiomyces paraingens]|uniref:F-box domain-containing protein n=1 Tax=Magnusiomyces paraingens TaxID=2606893 RepID=A0A5E8B2L5_9ASCO|nr:uncharacterized protein SAPINGB_P000183 [Saprochaete ingens]VVT43862.1 unnamed protein product [Saprochaete ingens]
MSARVQALDCLSSDIYVNLYEFLPPQALFSLIQTSAALRAAFQGLAWEHCELASPHARPEKHESFGRDGSRLQVSFAVLFHPHSYSWFPNTCVRSIHIDLRGLRNMLKANQRLPLAAYPRLTSISYHEKYDQVPVLREHDSAELANIRYPTHFNINEYNLITGSLFDASFAQFLSVDLDLYNFWHLKPHAFTRLTSIEFSLHPAFPQLIQALPTFPNLERLSIVCYVVWTDRSFGDLFPKILPEIQNIKLTSTFRACELKFSRVLPVKDFNLFEFAPLDQIRSLSKITVPSVTSISCSGTMPLVSIGECFTFPGLQKYREMPQLNIFTQLPPFPPVFLSTNCLETVTSLVLGVEFKNEDMAMQYLEGLEKFKNLKKLGLEVFSPWDHTCCFLYSAVDAVCNFQESMGNLQEYTEQRIEEMVEEIQGFRYIDYWKKIAKYTNQKLFDFIAFIKDQKTEVAWAAMDVLNRPNQKTFLEVYIPGTQDSREEHTSIDDFGQQIFHFRIMELLFEQLMNIKTLEYLQFTIDKKSLYFYCTPRFLSLFNSHPSLKQVLISRDQYVYDTFLFCSLLSFEETKKQPYTHNSFSDMTYQTMMHQFPNLPYSFYFLPAHQRTVDFQIVVDIEHKRQFKREDGFPKTLDEFCLPFSDHQFEGGDFNGWI